MTSTPGEQRALAPKPVSSTSSIDTVGSAQTDTTPRPVLTHQPLNTTVVGQERVYTNLQPAPSFQARPVSVPIEPPSTTSFIQARPAHVQISPSTGVVVPSAIPSSNTVPEFLYQLTKMLTDNNRDIIEWSNGKANPLLLQTIIHRYHLISRFCRQN